MSSDVGRSVAVLLAIVLAVTVPLSIKAEVRSSTVNSLAQAAVDELTARVEREGAVTLAAYEDLLAELSGIGLICDAQLQIGRHELKYSDLHPAAEPARSVNTQLCASHVHTAACYKGHNHEAAGCTYHNHSSACYCSGSMTRRYKTSSQFIKCTSCDGSGTTGSVSTCTTCAGTGIETYRIVCNSCTNGRTYAPVTCTTCGGSGKNSKGRTCSKCDGIGKIEKIITCSLCSGTGYRYKSISCSSCRGKGKTSTLTTCSSCNGNGGSYIYTDYYECNVCGWGSTTSYGGSCGRKLCDYQNSGYTCGYSSNDTSPICGQIIADVAYKADQTVNLNDLSDVLDKTLSVRYLNGNMGTVNASVDDSIEFREFGDTEVNLVFTGYFETAGGYGTRRFPVHVTVLSGGRICAVCGRTYYPEDDGNDGGCPYCYRGIVGIRVECTRTEYQPGDQFEANVYAVFADGSEMPVPGEDTWNTFDSAYSGEISVFVGYLQYMQEVNVYVHAREDAGPTPLPETNPDADEDEGLDNPEVPGVPGENDAGNGDEESDNRGDEGLDNIADDYVVTDSAYEEFLTTEEILDILENSGRIGLNRGDAFSVRITVENMKGFSGFFRDGKMTFTSGVIID